MKYYLLLLIAMLCANVDLHAYTPPPSAEHSELKDGGGISNRLARYNYERFIESYKGWTDRVWPTYYVPNPTHANMKKYPDTNKYREYFAALKNALVYAKKLDSGSGKLDHQAQFQGKMHFWNNKQWLYTLKQNIENTYKRAKEAGLK